MSNILTSVVNNDSPIVPITQEQRKAQLRNDPLVFDLIQEALVVASQQQAAAAAQAAFGRIYTPFGPGDVIANQQETVTKGLWSGNVGSLTTFFTSSAQTVTQKQYYYEVFQSASSAPLSAPQFSVAYGNKFGSGSADQGGQVNDSPARAIYSQYKCMLLEPGDNTFTINGVDTNQIYIVNVNRARMRESLDPGNIQISLAPLSGAFVPNSSHTGSNVKVLTTGTPIKLVDDSLITPASIGQSGKRYHLISGSIEDGVFQPSNPVYYGLLYPQLGVAVLNADMLDKSASFNTVTGSGIEGDNAFKLFTSISGAAANFLDNTGDRLAFEARSSELVKSTYYFIRAKNSEYNFSNNPTFVTGADGDLAEPTFVGDPKVYITTVGLYNNRQELLAVAKLSKPLLKSFTREALIKVKLDF
jgi:hypothetical protein